MCAPNPQTAGAGLETGEHDLVGRDRHQAGQGNLQDVVMEKRDAKQGRGKEDEINRDARYRRRTRTAIRR
jgi:hypothetical protein